MNHIGNLIKEYRCKIGLSRKNLASDLCSDTYVYMIEKGERTPSSELLRQFSDRLGVDLFNMYQYLDCYNPIKVYETTLLFDNYKQNSNFKNLMELTEMVKDDPDFLKAPWRCEIAINKYTCMVLVDEKIHEAISDLKSMVAQMNQHNCLDKHIAEIYSLLSIAYQLLGAVKESRQAIESALRIIKNKSNMCQYKDVVVTIKLTFLFMCLQAEQYETIVQEGMSLLDYQAKNNMNDRNHHTYYLLSMANYYLGRQDLAIKYFKNVIYATLIHERPFDISKFLENEAFIKLINSDLLDRRTMKEYCQQYQIDTKAYDINI